MARVIVAGMVNIDRIWRLTGPLCPGGRVFYDDVTTRLGGGAFNTGAALLDLGHDVVLVAALAADDQGEACRATLERRGFDTRFVVARPGRSEAGEILVDPSGERTILGRAGENRAHMATLPSIEADAVYVNFRRAGTEFAASMARFPLVVAQYPLEPAQRRPADLVIASRADLAIAAPAEFWDGAVAIAGSRLRAAILTAGTAPLTVATASAVDTIAVAAVSAPDTTGAGDVFAAGCLDGLLAGHAAAVAAERAAAEVARRLRQPDAAGLVAATFV